MADFVSRTNPTSECVKLVGETSNGNATVVCSSGLTSDISVTYNGRKTNEFAVNGYTQLHHKEMVDLVPQANGTSDHGDAGNLGEMSNGNSTGPDRKTGLSGLTDSLATYKRRKTNKFAVDGNKYVTELNEKSAMHLFDEDKQRRSDDPKNNSSNLSLKHPKNIVLEQICHSLDNECGLSKCIKSAIALQPGSDSRTCVKESVHSCENGSNGTFQSGSAHDGVQNAAWSSVGMISNGSVHKPNHGTVAELCLTTFSDIIMSEMFGQLCSLLLEHFPGMKADGIFDLNLISSRMKGNLYDNSPMLFHSDLQQIWATIQKVGTDMISLAKCLSEKTSSSFHKQAGSSVASISEDAKPGEFDMHAKGEPTEECAQNEVHKCSHCGQNVEGRDGLVCDACEEMYHISCVVPAIKEIPSNSWYCANCTAKGIECPHINCVACERLHASRSPFKDELGYGEDIEDCSNELFPYEGNKRFHHCKVCSTEVTNKDDYRVCGHSLCPHKFYHVRCLTGKQLVSYGPCWYCPSCLCRGCFTDQDDDKIVLCDGCDHAYHIYCMQPPLSIIPSGNWFCKKCDSGIQLIREAKRSYENMNNNSAKLGKVPSGGVDMLLNAAKTLNYEENLTAMGRYKADLTT